MWTSSVTFRRSSIRDGASTAPAYMKQRPFSFETIVPIRLVAAVFVLLTVLTACSYYSFTGATIPSHLNTVAIPLVEDQSISIVDDLNERMTRLLTDRFVGQTRLRLSTDETEADAVLLGRIERITVEPVAVGGGDRATQNRVTVTFRAIYTDRAQDQELLSRSFSASANYDPTAGDERAAETAAIVRALENVADDVFTAATSNW